MVIVAHGGVVDGVRCAVHRLPPGAEDKLNSGYGMRLIAFGRGGRSEPAIMNPRYFEFFSLSHLIEGRGFYWTPSGGTRHFEAGSAVLMPPNVIHSYGGDHQVYVEDSICFHGPVADSLLRAGIIRAGVMNFGFERRLLPLIERAMDPLEVSQIGACIELQRLLLSLNIENTPLRSGDGAKGRIDALIEDLKLTPEYWWTVEEMAEKCGLGEVQFRRLFKEVAGMSPKRYIEKLKMQRAIEMLVGGRESVAEIGRRLSYADPFHFSRRFKESTGLSPADYRRSMIS